MKQIFLFLLHLLPLLLAAQGTYTFSYDANGNLLTKQLVGNGPNINIQGDTLICPGSSTTLTASGAMNYSWNTGATNASVLVTPTQQNTIYRVRGTASNGCTNLKTWKVELRPKPMVGLVSGDSLPLVQSGNAYSYTVPNHQGSIYQWFVEGGDLVSGYGSSQVSVEWTANSVGKLKVIEVDTKGCKSDTTYLPVAFRKTQIIPHTSNWNLISTYIQPTNSSIASVFQPINANLVEVRDENTTYVNDPSFFPFNSLTHLTDGQGYWVKTNATCSLIVTGKVLQPINLPITLNTGWNLIAYPCQASQGIDTAFAAILPYIQTIKHVFRSYNPSYPMPFNTLTKASPGEGYWVYATSPTTFSFPDPHVNGSKTAQTDTITAPPGWSPISYPGSMVGYGKVTLNDYQVEKGDLIAAFVKGECRSLAIVNNEMGYSLASMVINGVEKDSITFHLFHDNQEFISDYHSQIENGVNVDTLLPLVFRTPFSQSAISWQLYPNPISDKLTFQGQFHGSKNINLEIWDNQGRKVIHLLRDRFFQSGIVELEVPTSLITGTYWVKVLVDKEIYWQKIIKE